VTLGIGVITPYRRVCGSALLLLVSVVLPNVAFAAGIVSAEAGTVTPWIVLACFVAFAMLPPVRRVSERASWLVLASTALAIALGYGFEVQIKESLAQAAGMFDAPPVWRDAPAAGRPFTHPMAGYTTRVPAAWKQEEGPMKSLYQFVRREGSTVAALLRPSCDVGEEPLAVTVRKLEAQWPDMRRTCSHWHGLDCCLLRWQRPHGEEWIWFARARDATRSIRMEFQIDDSRLEREAYAIINAVKPAPASFVGSPCPVPVEWASGF
jgi:hypothetical protein